MTLEMVTSLVCAQSLIDFRIEGSIFIEYVRRFCLPDEEDDLLLGRFLVIGDEGSGASGLDSKGSKIELLVMLEKKLSLDIISASKD